MSNKEENRVVQGWAELLFRKSPLDRLESEDALIPGDYTMAGGAIPLAEFHGPFEIYDHYSRDFEDHPGIPRNLEQYDLIHIIKTSPDNGRRLFLLAEHVHHKHLFYKGCMVHYNKTHPLSLIPIRRAFPSFVQL